jgi:putative SOS response-associated peptidase YedK
MLLTLLPLRDCSVALPICDNFGMCGRYKLSRRKQVFEEYFDAISSEKDWVPRYNIAPTQPVAVIRQHPKEPVRELSLMRWGLIRKTRPARRG